MSELRVFPANASPSAALLELAAQVESDGGTALCGFKEPIGHKWHLFALLPAALVKPTPFQRDLSPTHTKRMGEVMKKLGRYTEPIVAVRTEAGEYWTPNGNHRRAAAVKLGAEIIPAIVIPDLDVAYQILALNTEKVHNLRDKALEVIRMYRGKLTDNPDKAEKTFAFEFERPHFATLGLIYEKKARFSGAVYAPLLSRVDKFLNEPLHDAFEEREQRAAQIERADELLNDLISRAKKRGLTHPYLKNYIIARCNPLTRARKNVPSCKSALDSMCRALEQFDLTKIHFGEVRTAAAIAAASAEA
ncbi:MAG TPA: ParB/RepB/Spo0J family partition protein [Candidatus Binataceae bacterium]|nr:ParB/RepB/Spo0J family partition protein [Candidatus Binataceae bacterium]